jgi:hypothetical protein
MRHDVPQGLNVPVIRCDQLEALASDGCGACRSGFLFPQLPGQILLLTPPKPQNMHEALTARRQVAVHDRLPLIGPRRRMMSNRSGCLCICQYVRLRWRWWVELTWAK